MDKLFMIVGAIMVILGIGFFCSVLFAIPIYFLWGWLASYFGLPILTLWQAWGLSLLCSLLFKSNSFQLGKAA